MMAETILATMSVSDMFISEDLERCAKEIFLAGNNDKMGHIILDASKVLSAQRAEIAELIKRLKEDEYHINQLEQSLANLEGVEEEHAKLQGELRIRARHLKHLVAALAVSSGKIDSLSQ